MTDEEYTGIYSQLVAALAQSDKGWLVEEVEDYIHQGKVQTIEKVETLRIKNDKGHQKQLWQNAPTVQFQRGPRADFLTISDYTAQERLLLLIDALKTVVEHRLNIEEEVLSFFSDNLHTDTIIIYSEEEQRDTAKFQQGVSRRERAEEFLRYLQALRKEITNE
jgi:hypothetical protein